jgi:hypothetical protein
MLTKSPPYRSENYLRFIREQPCLICEYSSEAHHTKGAGVAIKGPDTMSVPLCRLHHLEGDMVGWKTFQANHNIDFQTEIIRLNGLYIAKLEAKNAGK